MDAAIYQVHQGTETTDRPTDRPTWMDSAVADGYMRNYGLAHFQREAKKKPPLCDDTHLADEPEKD